jgi:hypothetical protein
MCAAVQHASEYARSVAECLQCTWLISIILIRLILTKHALFVSLLIESNVHSAVSCYLMRFLRAGPWFFASQICTEAYAGKLLYQLYQQTSSGVPITPASGPPLAISQVEFLPHSLHPSTALPRLTDASTNTARTGHRIKFSALQTTMQPLHAPSSC